MSKDYEGYELVKAIHDKEIKDNTLIEVHDLSTLDHIVTVIKYKDNKLNWQESSFSTKDLFDNNVYFRLIEEEQEIDIQEIKELNEEISATIGEVSSVWTFSEKQIVEKQNQLIKAVKQLDNQINNK